MVSHFKGQWAPAVQQEPTGYYQIKAKIKANITISLMVIFMTASFLTNEREARTTDAVHSSRCGVLTIQGLQPNDNLARPEAGQMLGPAMPVARNRRVGRPAAGCVSSAVG